MKVQKIKRKKDKEDIIDEDPNTWDPAPIPPSLPQNPNRFWSNLVK